jgi:hypothetical protein
MRYAYRSAQPLSLSATGVVSQTVFGPSSDRIRADGSIVERNTGRKENEYSSLDLRLAREFALGKRVRLEPILEVFNCWQQELQAADHRTWSSTSTRSRAARRPAQMQLGVRLFW